jgi:hypothetical protein
LDAFLVTRNKPLERKNTMTRKTKILASTTSLLAVAAFSGLITGAANHASAATGKNVAAKTMLAGSHAARTLAAHDCSGKNDCKGQGGCGSSDNGCKGKNSCKGKGGCNTSMPASQPSI